METSSRSPSARYDANSKRFPSTYYYYLMVYVGVIVFWRTLIKYEFFTFSLLHTPRNFAHYTTYHIIRVPLRISYAVMTCHHGVAAEFSPVVRPRLYINYSSSWRDTRQDIYFYFFFWPRSSPSLRRDVFQPQFLIHILYLFSNRIHTIQRRLNTSCLLLCKSRLHVKDRYLQNNNGTNKTKRINFLINLQRKFKRNLNNIYKNKTKRKHTLKNIVYNISLTSFILQVFFFFKYLRP